MIGLSWELAGCFILFEMLQAIVASAIITLLLWRACWQERKPSARKDAR